MDPMVERALLDAEDSFLCYLRALMLWHNAGPDRRAEAAAEVRQLDDLCNGAERARELGFLTPGDGDGPSFTPLGKKICDGVKQYCNWQSHRDELPRGVKPDMIDGASILDVGCGVGCALMTFGRHGARHLAGLDIMETFPTLARIFAVREGLKPPVVVLGDGAKLPFQDDAFDFVFCRLAIDYMKCNDALAEMARIARDGAHIVVTLSMLKWHLGVFKNQIRQFNWKGIGFSLLRFGNGLLYHTLHRQVTLHYGGKMHSAHSPLFHTPRTMRRELDRWNLEPIWDDATESPLTTTFQARRRPKQTTSTGRPRRPVPTGQTR